MTAVASILSLVVLFRAWNYSAGLAVRPMVAWGFTSVGFGLIAQASAFAEPFSSGRPMAGHWAYLATLAALAALISSLGARKPGGGAWAILMGLLVLVLLIPWLEGFGLKGRSSGLDRLRMEAPWSIFYGLLVLAGVTNYLPTAFGRSAWVVGGGFVVEFIALTFTNWSASTRASLWCLVPFLFAVGILVAADDFQRRPAVATGLPSLWLWFRDLWGVVWALRVRERFQKTAESVGWPIVLSWSGPTDTQGGDAAEIPADAVQTFEILLRRFADPERLRQAKNDPPLGACPEAAVAGE